MNPVFALSVPLFFVGGIIELYKGTGWMAVMMFALAVVNGAITYGGYKG
jgi:hypothetical protein